MTSDVVENENGIGASELCCSNHEMIQYDLAVRELQDAAERLCHFVEVGAVEEDLADQMHKLRAKSYPVYTRRGSLGIDGQKAE